MTAYTRMITDRIGLHSVLLQWLILKLVIDLWRKNVPQGAMLTMNVHVDKVLHTCRPVIVLDLVVSSASFSWKRKKKFILRNLVLCTIPQLSPNYYINARPSIHCLYFVYAHKIYVRTQVKITQQWKSAYGIFCSGRFPMAKTTFFELAIYS